MKSMKKVFINLRIGPIFDLISAKPYAGAHQRGATLIELMVVVVIVGLLAALALPALSSYVKESRLSETTGNIQAILESEEAYLARFQHYTRSLPYCPAAIPPKNQTVVFRKNAADCPDWEVLGWYPDSGVHFRYRVATHYDGSGVDQPATLRTLCTGGSGGCAETGWAIDWEAEGFTLPPIQPWCAVEAQADTDGDGKLVFMRSNSINNKVYRSPNPRLDNETTY